MLVGAASDLAIMCINSRICKWCHPVIIVENPSILNSSETHKYNLFGSFS